MWLVKPSIRVTLIDQVEYHHPYWAEVVLMKSCPSSGSTNVTTPGLPHCVHQLYFHRYHILTTCSQQDTAHSRSPWCRVQGSAVKSRIIPTVLLSKTFFMLEWSYAFLSAVPLLSYLTRKSKTVAPGYFVTLMISAWTNFDSSRSPGRFHYGSNVNVDNVHIRTEEENFRPFHGVPTKLLKKGKQV